MEKSKSHINAILDLTLEIVYLLTGESYSLVKTSSLERDIYPPMSRKWNRTQSPFTVPPTSSLTPERNEKKILEVTQKMIELLTGEVSSPNSRVSGSYFWLCINRLDGLEACCKVSGWFFRFILCCFIYQVPIRCQDVTVYFTMEEWEYLEGHKELYKDAMMASQPALTSPDGSSNGNPPERCPHPLHSRESTQERHKDPQQHEGDHLIVVKIENNEDKLYLRSDGQYAEEEEEDIPLEIISGDEQRSRKSSEVHVISSPEYEDLVDSSPREDPFTNHIHTELFSVDRSPDPSEEPYPDTLYELSPDLHPDLSRGSRSPNTSAYGVVLVDTADTDTHGVVEPFFCSTCAKWFLLKLPPGQHKTTSPKVPFLCPDCGRCLTQHEGLPQPRRTDIVKLTHVCFECGRCFTVESNLFRHRLTHSKDQMYQSAKDGAWCRQSAEHQIKHGRSGEGLLDCSECGEQLSGKACLLNHERLHAEEKPYPRSEVGKSFMDQVVLYQHHERVFTDYKPFSCPECGKFYTSKSVLNRHLKLHSDYKPFPCSVCGKCFANKSLLNSHRRVHSKPFSCAECGKCFTFRYHLTKHEMTHAGGSQKERNFLYASELLDNATTAGQAFNF